MKATSREGFTLLELAVVLGIIALLTHLAVREAGQWRAARLWERSNRGLEELRLAILGDELDRTADGALDLGGFLTDMGRLPQAVTNAQGSLTLAELWTPPPADLLYSVRAATAANMPSNSFAEADGAVMLGGGWRGPYLRLPWGGTRLADGWGNPCETPDSAGFARLMNSSSNAVAPGETIALVRHLGADGRPDRRRWRRAQDAPSLDEPADDDDDAAPRRRRSPPAENRDGVLDLSDTPGGLAALTNAVLSVTVTACDSAGLPYTGASLPVTVRVYTPENGLIAVRKAGGTLSEATFNATITGLTPGRRVLRVECNGRKSPPRTITVRPGSRSDPVTEKILITP